MAIEKFNEASMSPENTIIRRRKLAALLNSDQNQQNDLVTNYNHIPHRNKTNLSFTTSTNSDPSSPCNSDSTSSPYANSPWTRDASDHNYPNHETEDVHDMNSSKFGLIGSIQREEGHIYSLAARGNLLYTGSDSKNIRVWKNLEDFSGFKSGSGLVKAIVLFGDRIFTGHQDGKIRVWSLSDDDDDECNAYKRVGNLPTTRDLFVKSVSRRNYVKVRRNRTVPWIKHYDAVSCMSVDAEKGLLYSGSWDRTLKVWRISDSKCMESIRVHDDAVNSVVVAFDGVVFTGSADGSVKAWRRVTMGNNFTKHVLVETLLKQDHAVTSLAVSNVSGKATLYAGSSDGLVSFWEREKNFMSYGGVLRGHKMAVLCMATAGNLVVSGSADNSICVWRRDDGGAHACVEVLTGHDGPVKCLTVEKEEEEGSGKGWIVYSGSLDKSVKVWRVSDCDTSVDNDTCSESI